MIKETSLKIFLTSGVTLTVKEDEKIFCNGEKLNLIGLYLKIKECVSSKQDLEFNVVITHKYMSEDGKENSQEIKHDYYISSERISWHMIEEV